MKPTPEIIELARKLNKLGWTKEITKGDWYLRKDNNYGTGWSPPFLWQYQSPLLKQEGIEYASIPSLSQCLRWLRDKIPIRFIVSLECPKEDEGEVDCLLDDPLSTDFKPPSSHSLGDTPEEAAMLAVLKILEGKNE